MSISNVVLTSEGGLGPAGLPRRGGLRAVQRPVTVESWRNYRAIFVICSNSTSGICAWAATDRRIPCGPMSVMRGRCWPICAIVLPMPR